MHYEYKCPYCGIWAPKKKFANGGPQDISVDHQTDWKKWMNEHAKPDAEGKITLKAAQDAHNDLANLGVDVRRLQLENNKKGKGTWD